MREVLRNEILNNLNSGKIYNALGKINPIFQAQKIKIGYNPIK